MAGGSHCAIAELAESGFTLMFLGGLGRVKRPSSKQEEICRACVNAQNSESTSALRPRHQFRHWAGTPFTEQQWRWSEPS